MGFYRWLHFTVSCDRRGTWPQSGTVICFTSKREQAGEPRSDPCLLACAWGVCSLGKHELSMMLVLSLSSLRWVDSQQSRLRIGDCFALICSVNCFSSSLGSDFVLYVVSGCSWGAVKIDLASRKQAVSSAYEKLIQYLMDSWWLSQHSILYIVEWNCNTIYVSLGSVCYIIGFIQCLEVQ